MEFQHQSILLQECIEGLHLSKKAVVLDATLGGGGHSEKILEKIPEGLLIALDQDQDALLAAGQRLEKYREQIVFRKANFKDFDRVLDDLSIRWLDAALFDIGVSSYQLDEASRGFSYMKEGPLDMRMDQENPLSAKELLMHASEEELARIFWDYGEEKWSRRIAQNIVLARSEKSIETTSELSDLVCRSIPAKALKKSKGHPAKRVFQALRIEINQELKVLEDTLPRLVSRLRPGGRLAVITFHSLEDRIVKNTFRELAKDCLCPKELPVCVCNHKAQVKIITPKPILPSKEEQAYNSRAHSAKLRIVEKLPQ